VTSTPPVIRLDRLSKWYGDVLAVNEVSAEFGPGVTGLLGPNGAGKSSLLKCVTGMLAPSLGTVTVCGEAPFDRPHVMRRVGLVPEQDPTYAGATAFEVTVYLTRLHGFSAGEASARAHAVLERVGLSGAMDRPVRGYSKGMRQRAKLAQALAHEPDVLILDEPLNGLDPVARREIVALIHDLGAEGRCLLVSSHVLHEVESMTRRVLLMDHGRMIADGTISEIRRDLSDRPLSVRIESSAPRELAKRIVALDGVARIDVGALDVLVWTNRPNDLFAGLAAWSNDDRIPIGGYGPTDESLEAVFRYLTT
jgi:ABC-2 type transport system ATP-binding protein